MASRSREPRWICLNLAFFWLTAPQRASVLSDQTSYPLCMKEQEGLKGSQVLPTGSQLHEGQEHKVLFKYTLAVFSFMLTTIDIVFYHSSHQKHTRNNNRVK